MGQRYYSPELCRFIQPDSIEYLDPSSINGLNLYCYCMNNPIMYYDPSGHSALLVLASVLYLGLMGAATSVTVQAITDMVQGNEFDINNYLIAGVSGFVGGALGFVNPYLGSIAQGMLSTGLSMGYKEYQGKADYVWQDYAFAIGTSIATSFALTGIFRGIVKNTNAFETAMMFGDDLPTWFDCGNEVFFEMLGDLTPYYLTYSLTNSASGLFFAGIPEYAREVVALKRLGLSWGQAFKYAF